jgi:hypothetical protein
MGAIGQNHAIIEMIYQIIPADVTFRHGSKQ